MIWKTGQKEAYSNKMEEVKKLALWPWEVTRQGNSMYEYIKVERCTAGWQHKMKATRSRMSRGERSKSQTDNGPGGSKSWRALQATVRALFITE